MPLCPPPGWAQWAVFNLKLELHRGVHGGHVGLQPLVTAISLCWEMFFPQGTPQPAPGRGYMRSLPRHVLSPWGHL